MDFKGGLDNLMQEAQKMQEKMQEAQKSLANIKVIGESGGGLVKIEMNGRHDVTSVKMNPNLLHEDIEMIEDLTAAAINDAVQKIEKRSKALLTDLTSGFKMPTDFKMPDDEDDL
jgi:DNA-binding YbaB/EbfC family protein